MLQDVTDISYDWLSATKIKDPTIIVRLLKDNVETNNIAKNKKIAYVVRKQTACVIDLTCYCKNYENTIVYLYGD